MVRFCRLAATNARPQTTFPLNLFDLKNKKLSAIPYSSHPSFLLSRRHASFAASPTGELLLPAFYIEPTTTAS